MISQEHLMCYQLCCANQVHILRHEDLASFYPLYCYKVKAILHILYCVSNLSLAPIWILVKVDSTTSPWLTFDGPFDSVNAFQVALEEKLIMDM
uniref:Uncharacterized protein n=1 Tax=Romanomermis culicivorax TaxID=13658 RepID=A0A915KQJ2_ROMCU